MEQPNATSKPRPDVAGGGAHLVVKNLWKVFDHGGRRIEVLRGIDLDLPAGALVSIVGASGVGKSTLLHLLGTLDVPTKGTIAFDGTDVTSLSPGKLATFRNRAIGFVFQFHHLLPAFTATENVLIPGLIAHGPVTPERRQAARDVLRAVGLGDRLDYPPRKLSGGQQQRVAIARALSLAPPLVLADEPTGNLDTHSADEIFGLMRKFNEERGVAFLIVTHDPRLAGRCDRIVELVDGTIAGDRSNIADRSGEHRHAPAPPR
jgi:lipoprotein-releasing system ATP-binding protein